MKRLLILSYYWPPAGGPGVQRWVKMSKQLVDLGFEVTVITVANGSYPSIDESLISEVDPNIDVIKTKTLEPFALFNRLRGERGKESTVGMIGLSDRASFLQRIAVYIRANFFVPDARKGWHSYALAAAKRVISEKEFSAVISTGPPHSVHAVAKELKASFGLKWLADLRDPWVNIHYHDQMPLGKRALEKHRHLEDETLRTADAVTVVSPGMKREFEDRADRIEVIFNGYDAQDFSALNQEKANSRFTIRYTGNLKPNQDVPALWKALSELCEREAGFKEDLRIELIGKKDPRVLAQNQALLPEGTLQSIDAVPHARAVKAMCSADLLLFIIPQSKNNKLILTGKLFEYLASQSPMLSIGPKTGDAARILADVGRDDMLDYNDLTGIKEQILSHYKHWKSGETKEAETNNEAHTRFSRTAQSSAYAKLITTVID